jgi:hypothetical protein
MRCPACGATLNRRRDAQLLLVIMIYCAPSAVLCAGLGWSWFFIALIGAPIVGYLIDVHTVQLYHATEWRNWFFGYKD